MVVMKPSIEELKKRTDGLDVLPQILRAAQMGFEKMDKEYIDLFRWYGLYQQKPKDGYFMLRIKIPNGELLANQIRAVAAIANSFGRGLVDITTRQNYQLHWIKIEDVPEIFERLHNVGLLTTGACGDVPRNVVGCPVAGLDAEEFCDATPIVKRVSAFLTGNKDFSNLPRKFKISISGCRQRCAQPDINDIGIYGTERLRANRYEYGFGLMVGGGLSTRPYFAADLGVFLKPGQVFEVVHRIAIIFRDAEVLRKDRSKSRLKFLIHDPQIGIGPQRFRALLEEKLGYQLEDHHSPEPLGNSDDDHLGIRPQRQEGFYYIGVPVLSGRTTGDTLLRLADLAEEYSTQAMVRNTNKQNFILTFVPEHRVPPLAEKLKALGLPPLSQPFRRGMVSCTGNQFCNLAITETKNLSIHIAERLERLFPEARPHVRIHISGCPNNCAQTAIADIGLRGGLTKVDGQSIESYDLVVGGRTGAGRRFAEIVARKIPASEVVTVIANLYRAFLAWSKNGETFSAFVDAMGTEQLAALAQSSPESRV